MGCMRKSVATVYGPSSERPTATLGAFAIFRSGSGATAPLPPGGSLRKLPSRIGAAWSAAAEEEEEEEAASILRSSLRSRERVWCEGTQRSPCPPAGAPRVDPAGSDPSFAGLPS